MGSPKPGTTTTCGAKKGCFAVLGLMLVSSGLDNPSTGQPSTLIVIKRKYLHNAHLTNDHIANAPKNAAAVGTQLRSSSLVWIVDT